LNFSFIGYFNSKNPLKEIMANLWLAERLKHFREQYNQTPEGIAILLNISPEEYLQLEDGLIPGDELIRLICQLFEWNYNEVIQKISQKAGSTAKTKTDQAKAASPKPNDFSSLVKTSRLNAGQNFEGMALLLNISELEYQNLEEGSIPGDALLKKLCQVFQWNYSDAKKLILKTTNAKFVAEKTKETVQIDSLNQLPPAMEGLSFGEILLQARLRQGATLESLALLLNIDEEELEGYEAGEIPSEPMLKKICSLFEWNYNEILGHLRNLGFSRFPASKADKPKTSARIASIKDKCSAIQGESVGLADESLKILEIQLELIQKTIREIKARA
jgi:transcriptional regulator with XRE-family HTH domain